MDLKQPELLVAIDVGMTCTGVAWSLRNESMVMTDPYVINKWPGAATNERNKVPTQLCYRKGELSSWGFAVNHEDETDSDLEFIEWFKIYLDPVEWAERRKRSPEHVPVRHEFVRKYYRDFLRELYKYIYAQLEEKVRSWHDASIEFLFSVPTTWTSLGVIADFQELAREAGFASGGAHHRIQVGLTEAEAAAVYTLKAQSVVYEDGDVMLVVDAGGGTTDLALLRVHKRPEQPMTLEALDKVRGDEIGSVEIDTAFEELARERLEMFKTQLRRAPEDIAMEMTHHGFQHHKEEFGSESGLLQDMKLIVVPGLSDAFESSSPVVKGGRLCFTNREIQSIFDTQMTKMFRLIDHQVSLMRDLAPDEQITHMILSGGLGSSEYVKTQLKERYMSNRSPGGYCAKALRIISALQPQLAVVKGLVQNRMQELSSSASSRSGLGVLTTRICRQSYGIVCMEKYNPQLHQGQEVKKDPIDGGLYVTKQIDWLIKSGEPITANVLERPYRRSLGKKAPRLPWSTSIAISHNERAAVPDSLHRDGAKILCFVQSDLTHVPLDSFKKVKGKQSWWCGGKVTESYYDVNYTIRFLIRPASIEFELWFAGKQYNEPGAIEVKWQEGAEISAPRQHR